MAVLEPGISIYPVINENEVIKLVYQWYGLKVTKIKQLNGYDDRNYQITVESSFVDNKYISAVCKNGYVFKVINSLDSQKEQFFDAQNSILIYLGKNNFCCPQPVMSKNDCFCPRVSLSSGEHLIRLLEFIEGDMLHTVECSHSLLNQVGEYIGKLDDVLKGFHHPAYENHTNSWMLDNVPNIINFLHAVRDPDKKDLVNAIVSDFEQRVLAVKDNLEKSVIHGDYNEQNILVCKDIENNEWKVKAILDFGDSHYGCLLFEIAIAMTYMILHTRSIESGGYVLAGYSTIRNLPDHEFNLLRVCVAARISMSLVLGAYTNLLNPENDYVLTTAKFGWEILQELWNIPEKELLSSWRTIMETY